MATTRTRVMDLTTSSTWSTTTMTNGVKSVTSGETTKVGLHKVMNDVKHSNFRKALAGGGVVLGDMNLTVSETSWSDASLHRGPYPAYGNIYWDYAGNWCKFAADWLSTNRKDLFVPSTFENDLEGMGTQALLQAYGKVKSSSALVPEALADLDKSIGMLGRPFGSARDLLLRMEKAKARRLGKTASSVARAIADTHLEYRMGWSPIFLDIGNIIKASHKFREECDARRIVVRSGMNKEAQKAGSFENATVMGHWYITANGTVTQEVRVTADAGVIVAVESQTKLEHLNQVLGFRPNDLVQTVWEATPYSFIVDRFVGIGDWLQAVTPVPGVTYLGNWITRTVKKSTTYLVPNWRWQEPSYPTYVANGTFGSGVDEYFRMDRVVNNQLATTPALTVQPLSMLQQADHMALLVKPLIGRLKAFSR